MASSHPYRDLLTVARLANVIFLIDYVCFPLHIHCRLKCHYHLIPSPKNYNDSHPSSNNSCALGLILGSNIKHLRKNLAAPSISLSSSSSSPTSSLSSCKMFSSVVGAKSVFFVCRSVPFSSKYFSRSSHSPRKSSGNGPNTSIMFCKWRSCE